MDMKRKYANMLVRVGMNVQKGQYVLIEAAQCAWEFANLVAEEAYAAGAARVLIKYLDLHKLKIDALNLPVEEMSQFDPWDAEAYEFMMNHRACTLRLESEYPDLMRDLSDDRAHAVFARIDGLRNIMRGIMRKNHTQWCIAVVPNQAWAEKVFPNDDKRVVLDKFWNTVYKLCYLSEECDIVEVWKNRTQRRRAISEKLDELELESLHITSSNGTDLTIGLGRQSHFGLPKAVMEEMEKSGRVPFQANMPSEEFCTTPLRYKTNGVVYSTRPLLVGGKMVNRFWIRFKDGKAIECHAEEGEEMLRSIIETDENSGYLGEVAMVEYHSPISQSGLVFYTTLIDENASCHLALGRGFVSPEVTEEDGVQNPYNQSQIHIDFMFGAPDTAIVGTTRNGEQIQVFKDGDFAL
ncbi:MAG: aminopeptidase [Clostridia bacterium]|nr:aminopeptidase [Clostridia bacterium]